MLALALVLLVASSISESAPISYPRFMQCDPQWGPDAMGIVGKGHRSTVCGEGCAMSCVAMALSALEVKIDGDESTPGSLNAFLVKESLYTCAGGDCDNLILQAPQVLTDRLQFVSESRTLPSLTTIAHDVNNAKRVYLAHVRNGTHFVLVTGVNEASAGRELTVNDPFYNTTTYAYGDVLDFIIYDILAAPSPTGTVSHDYPLYKQCDAKWGGDVMEVKTVCDVGCLMSSVSMALHGWGISIEGAPANPGTLNAWLRTHQGYVGGDDLDEAAVPRINSSWIRWPQDGMHPTNDLPLETIRAYLVRQRVVIANVDHGHHFVLVTAFHANNETLFVNDPGFARTTYSYHDDVVGWRIYDMGPQ